MSIYKAIIMTILIGMSLSGQGQKQVSADDYDRAADQLYYGVSSMVDRVSPRIRWGNGSSFWYETLDPEGKRYEHFDASKRMKTTVANEEEAKKLLEPKKGQIDPSKFDRKGLSFSPDNSKAIFLENWNLSVIDADSQKEKALTTDGIENFGYATDNAGWRQSDRPIFLWSPDSKKIATYQQDQRHVSDMYMVSTEVGAPKLSQWKYPLPQDKEIIKIHRVIIDVETGEMVRLKMDADPRRGTLCDDITCDGPFDDNQWSLDGSRLIFVSSSRDHKVAQLREADAKTGEVRDIYREEVATQYESGQGAINWKYLEKSDEFIWYSEKDNWGHLYMHDFKTGKEKHQITKGDFVVTRVKKIDEDNKWIYFEANGKEKGRDPYYSHFYRVDFSGENLKLLTPEDANHRIRISPDELFFVDAFSKPDVPPTTVFKSIDGKLVETLEVGNIDRLKEKGWNPPEQIKVKSDDGKYDLYGLLFKPRNIEKGKKYPIVNYVYPGPQGGGVGSRSFRASRGDHQALAELGFVVVIIDGSCNPGRSKAFHDECYGDMSTNTLKDQISGIMQLAKKYDFMDVEKVGIWGHSGGGFATATAMFKYPNFYKVGISESGNHDNRNYEDDWGERYNGLMQGIGKGSVDYEAQANQIYAKNLKGKLMIAHGAMDDNVPVSNSMLVVDALIKANKDFDLLIFPHARHGFGRDGRYMMRKRWDYFVTHLQGNIPPKEYTFSFSRDPRTK